MRTFDWFDYFAICNIIAALFLFLFVNKITCGLRSGRKSLEISKKPWRLCIGVKRKTDLGNDTYTWGCETLEECIREAEKMEEHLNSLGLSMTFANARGPNGKVQRLQIFFTIFPE